MTLSTALATATAANYIELLRSRLLNKNGTVYLASALYMQKWRQSVWHRLAAFDCTWSYPVRSVRRFSLFLLNLTQEAIVSYNSRFASSWNFSVFEYLCTNELFPDSSTSEFFQLILPRICALALNLPVYLTRVCDCVCVWSRGLKLCPLLAQ